MGNIEKKEVEEGEEDVWLGYRRWGYDTSAVSRK